MVFSRPQVDDYNPLPNATLRPGTSRGTKSFNSRMVGKLEVIQIAMYGSVPTSRLVGSNRDCSRLTGKPELMQRERVSPTRPRSRLLGSQPPVSRSVLPARTLPGYGRAFGEAIPLRAPVSAGEVATDQGRRERAIRQIRVTSLRQRLEILPKIAHLEAPLIVAPGILLMDVRKG